MLVYTVVNAIMCQNQCERWGLKNKTITKDHDIPFGGKAEDCFPPSLVKRMNFMLLSPDQSPFHEARALITSCWLRSGNQKPVLNSLFSTSVRWRRFSSRLLGGRPFRRSLCNCSISGTLRLMYLCPPVLMRMVYRIMTRGPFCFN